MSSPAMTTLVDTGQNLSIVMAGFMPAIHALLSGSPAWAGREASRVIEALGRGIRQRAKGDRRGKKKGQRIERSDDEGREAPRPAFASGSRTGLGPGPEPIIVALAAGAKAERQQNQNANDQYATHPAIMQGNINFS
jgi:hypothetical protein